ncbi:MAG: hypothetical protein O3C21_20135, partial [Verrucomicrobia bacterium]|nr:hypothetical protein [Verrucomicrobiota bacterium]
VAVSKGEDMTPAITFIYRSSAVDLEYVIQLGDDLVGEWSEVWSSTLGLDHPTVVKKEEMGEGMMKVTVAARNAVLPAFLRVAVSTR